MKFRNRTQVFWNNTFPYLHSVSGTFFLLVIVNCRSQWPRGLRRRSAAARLLRSWVQIPPGAWMFVCCECYVLSGRGLCDELITGPEESYRQWCVVVCDLGKPHGWGSHSPYWAAGPKKKKSHRQFCKPKSLFLPTVILSKIQVIITKEKYFMVY